MNRSGTHSGVEEAQVSVRASAPENPVLEAALPSVAEIFAEYAPFVWRTLRYLGVAPSDLQDVCQDVFVVVHQKLPEFEGRASLRTWLYGICIRAAAGHKRRARFRREQLMAVPPDEVVAPTAAEQLDEHRARELLRQVLANVDEAKRQVFVLYEIEQRPMTEVAEALGCPLRTAYARLEAAREEVTRAWKRALAGSKA